MMERSKRYRYKEVNKNWILYRITSSYFCAGIEVDKLSEKIVEAAPILKYVIGWYISDAIRCFRRKGFNVYKYPTS